ncbi:MAG: hypothetical protein RIQ53_3646 [Pseudomonadota bacterium]
MTDLSPVPAFVAPDVIRSRFAAAMSRLYRAEVPLYGRLVDVVAEVNAATLRADAQALDGVPLAQAQLDVERHGAIRVGTAQELATLRRIFAVMGLQPVGYYDLSVAGVPVHSTAFRPVGAAALAASPLRLFTSLLRLELIDDAETRALAERALARRRIFTPEALALTARCEQAGGLSESDAEAFVQAVLPTFAWQRQAPVTQDDYRRLAATHRLVADVVCFAGPHINHLTPRTLDIDAAQSAMQAAGLPAKAEIEGPPRRRVPILLRQTSFAAVSEPVSFAAGSGEGTHTARFGEIEQRGLALTPAGRALYDRLLDEARARNAAAPGATAEARAATLAAVFADFPDDLETLRRTGLGWFRYGLRPGVTAQAAAAVAATVTTAEAAAAGCRDREDAGTAGTAATPVDGGAQAGSEPAWLQALLAAGLAEARPIVYEDFLPVSAAGIFRSNLAGEAVLQYDVQAAQAAFEQALGAPVGDPFALYAAEQQDSLARLHAALQAVMPDALRVAPRGTHAG